MSLFPTDLTRWRALNPRADGAFVYSVRTTSIYCRPTCKARLARRANVGFYNDSAEAEAAGFRACKRCRPELAHYDPQASAVARSCQSIRQTGRDAMPSLNQLAEQAGLSTSHFHRVFKKIMGVTPRVYALNAALENVTLFRGSLPLNEPAEVVTHGYSEGNSNTSPTSIGASTWQVGDYFARLIPIPNDELSGCCTAQDGAFEKPTRRSVNQGNPLARPGKDIEYTIQSWFSSYVLVALTQDGACCLDTGDSEIELARTLRHRFPLSHIRLSDWEANHGLCDFENKQHTIFAEMMGVLENPTGKMLDLPFDIS